MKSAGSKDDLANIQLTHQNDKIKEVDLEKPNGGYGWIILAVAFVRFDKIK